MSTANTLEATKKRIDMMTKITMQVGDMLMLGRDAVYLVAEHDNEDQLITQALADYLPKGGLFQYSESNGTYTNTITNTKVVIATSMQDAANKSSPEFVAGTVVVTNKWGRRE